jgi:hypothetical protein
MELPFETKLVGNRFKSLEAQQVARALKVGDLVALIPDPMNTYDKNAVAVYAPMADKMKNIGFIPKEDAAKLRWKEKEVLKGRMISKIKFTVYESTTIEAIKAECQL